ncbi:14032_t:CDS:2, partial [Ambispora leptoticha]
MGSKDLTVPIYRGAEVDDIKNFLFDFEGYGKAKKDLIQSKKTWKDLKKEIVEKIKSDNETEVKINRLKRVKQDERESVREYTNRYEAYTQAVKSQLRNDEKRDWYIRGLRDPYRTKVENRCPKNYDKAKKKALEMEEYNRDRALSERKDSNIPDETPQPSKADVDLDSIVNGLAALSINRVEREEKLNRSDIENMIQSAVAKTVKDLNRKQSYQKPNKPRTCFQCGQEGHIVKNCPNRNKGETQTNQGITFNNADVRLVEFTEKRPTNGAEYLRVELLDKDECGDIRAFDSRSTNEKPSSRENVMYIPFAELSDELDLLKKLADMEVTLTLGQLFKWSPKARSEIMKALTRRKRDSAADQHVKIRIVSGVLQDDTPKPNEVVPVWTVKINGDLVKAPIDPGSRINLMLKKYAVKRGLEWNQARGKGRMADNRVSQFVGHIPNVEVEMEGVVVHQDFYVMETASFDVLLGMPWNARAQCTLGFKGTEYWCTISSPTRSASFVVSTVPRSWIGEIQADYEDDADSNDESDYEEDVDDIMAVRRMDMIEFEEMSDNNRVLSIMDNAKNKDNVVQRQVEPIDYESLNGLTFGGWVNYWNRDDERDDGSIEGKDALVVSRLTMENSALINLGPRVRNEPIRSIVIKRLMTKVGDVFAYELKDIGKTNLVEYEVRTGDAIVPSMRLRPIRINNPETRQIFENHLREMIECGLLEKGSGEYAYHCFPVQKKEGGTDKIRAVGNMKPLNKYIIKDSYSLPVIRDILEQAAGHDWYSSVDAFKGYWQIGIREKDRDKVAVTTSLGVLRYTVMCMGLKNASETFQRLMDRLLDKEKWKNVAAAYQDDVGVWTNGSMEEHLETFIELAEVFKNAGLTFAAKKCYILYNELEMYGYVVSKEGIKVNPKRIEKIHEWKVPCNVNEVRSFHGVMNYYRRFVENFSKIAKPLTDLTKKATKFQWGPKEDGAFELLKRKLSDEVVLKAPNWQAAKDGRRPYQMYTDACDHSVGVVLEQEDDEGRLRPISFDSRKLNEHELHYTVTEKECLAIVFGCHVNERYIGGTVFDVWVDHQALEWLFNKVELKGRLMRWILLLQSFEFRVRYKSGKKHCNADGMSRYPDPPFQEIPTDDDFVDGQLYRVGLESQKISDLVLVKHYLQQMSWEPHVKARDLPRLKRKLKRYCLIGDNLYLRSRKGAPPKRVILDDRDKYEIVKACHDGLANESGHRGINRTLTAVKMKYVWGSGNMYDDVKRIVSSCEQCQRCAPKLPPEPIHVTATSWIFEKVYIDCVGPLPRTVAKHEHVVLAIEDLTGYVEGRALVKKNAKNIAQFIWEDIILRHGCFTALVSDRGTEFKNTIMEKLSSRLNVDQRFVASYHPEANGRAERVVQKFTRIIRKLCAERQNRWHEYVRSAIWAVNTTVGDLGYSPFRLVYGRDAIMPIELVMESYHTYVMRSQWTTDELLEYRTLQIKGLASDLDKARTSRDELKWRWKEFHDRWAKEREPIDIGDLVLIYDSTLDTCSRKLDYRWVGPYRVTKIGTHGQFYVEEVDGSKLKDPFTRNRVKKLKLDDYEPDCEGGMVEDRMSQVHEEQLDDEEY